MNTFLAVIGLATVIVTALIQYNSPKRSYERLIRELLDKELEFRNAVAKGDSNRVSYLSTELDELRRKIRLHPKS